MFFGVAPISLTAPLPDPAWATERKQFACCPVCSGKGLVPAGFYMAVGVHGGHYAPNTGPEQCRSCEGKGIVTL